jgi:phage recombination protein Bet
VSDNAARAAEAAQRAKDVVKANKPSLLVKFGERYGVDPGKVYETLCKTAFKDAKNSEQVMALLIVADQYGLNPFTKEIFAFPDKGGGVVPVVGVDGWNRISQQHPAYDGVDFQYSENIVTPTGGKPCPEWIEAHVYRKDRSHPVVVREYLDECFRNTGPWNSHTKRMLRHKALIQGYRVAFGFHGIYDQDEAEGFEIPEGGYTDAEVVDPVSGEVIDAEATEDENPSDGMDTAAEPGIAKNTLQKLAIATKDIDEDHWRAYMKEQYAVDSRKKLTENQGQEMLAWAVFTKGEK